MPRLHEAELRAEVPLEDHAIAEELRAFGEPHEPTG
jgi:hypothetical protein